MKLQDGIPQAMKLIKELKAKSLLVNFYDQSPQQLLGEGNPVFTNEDFKTLDELHGDTYRNHLLGIYIPPDFDPKKLIKVYPPLKDWFQDPGYPPIFIFINLAIQEVWLVKQSRRGSAFIINIKDKRDFDEELFEPDMPVNEFLALDHKKVIKRLYLALERITHADCNEFNGYGSLKDYRDAVSWHLPTINKCFPNLNIQADELARNF